jgi:hypothetical protein
MVPGVKPSALHIRYALCVRLSQWLQSAGLEEYGYQVAEAHRLVDGGVDLEAYRCGVGRGPRAAGSGAHGDFSKGPEGFYGGYSD